MTAASDDYAAIEYAAIEALGTRTRKLPLNPLHRIRRPGPGGPSVLADHEDGRYIAATAEGGNMKLKMFAALAAAAMMSLPGMAHAMDCCKDGKCACCAQKDEAPPAPQGAHQH
jgi:hypothetical protein